MSLQKLLPAVVIVLAALVPAASAQQPPASASAQQTPASQTLAEITIVHGPQSPPFAATDACRLDKPDADMTSCYQKAVATCDAAVKTRNVTAYAAEIKDAAGGFYAASVTCKR